MRTRQRATSARGLRVALGATATVAAAWGCSVAAEQAGPEALAPPATSSTDPARGGESSTPTADAATEAALPGDDAALGTEVDANPSAHAPDASPPVGHVVYTVADRVFRVEARAGAMPENLSTKLALLGAGSVDRRIDTSRAGNWLTLSTNRFSTDCSYHCLAVAPSDVASVELVRTGGAVVHPEGISAITSSGQLVVVPLQSTGHVIDLFVMRRTATAWSVPVNITQASTHPFNNMPVLSGNEQTVLFDCGQSTYPESGNSAVCEVGVDGTGFREVLTHQALPGARNNYLQNAHYSPSGILFEGSWPVGPTQPPPETIWRLDPTGRIDAIGASVLKSLSPCGLPDGRIVALWLGRPGNPQQALELTMIDARGQNPQVLAPGVDVADLGLGCSE